MKKYLVFLYIKLRLLIKKINISNKSGVFLGKNVKIDLYTKTEENVVIGNDCNIESSCFGKGTYLSEYCSLRNTSVGRYCAIADNVRCGSGTHPSDTFVSIHPAFFSTNKQAGFTFVKENCFDELPKVQGTQFSVEIGNDVWIGSGVRIMDGIRIGDGAIVGTGAVVTKDIEPYSIYVGVPAKKLRDRFQKQQREFLLAFKWWEKDFDWLRSNCEKFSDIDRFIECLSEKQS